MTEDMTEKTHPETVPSQSDLLRSISERLSIAVGTGGQRKGREGEKGKEKKLMKEDNG